MSDNELPPLPDECEAWWWPKTVVDGVNEWGRAIERAAYERAAKERELAMAKREPLPLKQINSMPEAQGGWSYADSRRVFKLIRAVERAHGIGGSDAE